MTEIFVPSVTPQETLPSSLKEMFGLEGKIALVLGGGFGMGQTTSNWLANLGCDVIVADLSSERAEAVAAEVRARGRRAHVAVGDLGDFEKVDRLLQAAEAELGGIDVVVSIVGQASWYNFLDVSMDQWRQDQRTNLECFVFASQWAARSMVRRGVAGTICAISSIDGMQGAPTHSGYGAAKAALISLVKSMAVELGRHGIRVNCIAPGSINTPRSIHKFGLEGKNEICRQNGVPLGRAGTPAEISAAIAYLVSDMARYVTGVCLPVDGGWTASRLDGAKYINPTTTQSPPGSNK